jgi:hypothetical protein
MVYCVFLVEKKSTTNQYTQFASDQNEISTEDHYDSVYGCIWHVYTWPFSNFGTSEYWQDGLLMANQG